MKAIMTKYLSPGNVKGARIKAFDQDGNRVILEWNHSMDGFENAAMAAEELKRKMKWKGELVGGSLKDGYVFVFVKE
jgi:stress response protein SCP2